MRTVIIGAGAIGGIAGGYLAKAGRAVRLIDANPDIVKKINRDGLEIISYGGQFTVKIQASESIVDFPWEPGDFILLCVKTQYSRDAIDRAADAAGSETPICCFQNTVQNEVMACERFKYVYGGVVLYSGTSLEPGKVFRTESDPSGVGVFPSGPPDDKLRSLVQEFKDTGINLYFVDDLMAAKYGKLLYNAAANAPCAILELTEPELMNLPEPRRLFDDILMESKRVLETAEIKYDESRVAFKPPDANLIPRGVPEGLQLICSTHQDLLLRRSVEVDYLNGELVALGKRYGVPTPMNELMVKLVHEMTDRGVLPGEYSVSDIRNMLHAGHFKEKASGN